MTLGDMFRMSPSSICVRAALNRSDYIPPGSGPNPNMLEFEGLASRTYCRGRQRVERCDFQRDAED